MFEFRWETRQNAKQLQRPAQPLPDDAVNKFQFLSKSNHETNRRRTYTHNHMTDMKISSDNNNIQHWIPTAQYRPASLQTPMSSLKMYEMKKIEGNRYSLTHNVKHSVLHWVERLNRSNNLDSRFEHEQLKYEISLLQKCSLDFVGTRHLAVLYIVTDFFCWYTILLLPYLKTSKIVLISVHTRDHEVFEMSNGSSNEMIIYLVCLQRKLLSHW